MPDGPETMIPAALEFAASAALSVGVEEEFMLVDGAGALTPALDQVLEEYAAIRLPEGEVKAELLRSTIEVATRAHEPGLLELAAELATLRAAAVERARGRDVRLAAAGLHPFSRADQQPVTPLESFVALAGLHASILQLERQATYGIHVHVGMPNIDAAITSLNAVAAVSPLLIALSANAPFLHGSDTGLSSVRAEYLRTNMWGGPPPHIADGSEYRSLHERMQRENQAPQRFLWEIAPVSWLGTLEVRICDAQADLDVTVALAALIQAVCALAIAGEPPVPRQPEALERHNRWSVTLFGPDANLLLHGLDDKVRAGDVCAELLTACHDIATDLGTAELLAPLAERCDRSAADVQRVAAAAGGMPALVDSLLLTD